MSDTFSQPPSKSARPPSPAPLEKWGYSALAAIIALAFASEPGGLSAIEGFFIAFAASVVALLVLEVLYSVILKREENRDVR